MQLGRAYKVEFYIQPLSTSSLFCLPFSAICPPVGRNKLHFRPAVATGLHFNLGLCSRRCVGGRYRPRFRRPKSECVRLWLWVLCLLNILSIAYLSFCVVFRCRIASHSFSYAYSLRQCLNSKGLQEVIYKLSTMSIGLCFCLVQVAPALVAK